MIELDKLSKQEKSELLSQDEVVTWFRKTAEQGYAEAQYWLGLCYYLGDGVTQDYNQAVAWYRKAAEQGYANAQESLSVCYYFWLGCDAERIRGFVLVSQGSSAGPCICKRMGAMP